MNKLQKVVNKTLDTFLDFIFKDYLQKKYDYFHKERYSIWGDCKKLSISSTSVVNNAFFNLSSGKIIIDNYVFFGHNVHILTGTHDYNKFNLARQNTAPQLGRDVIIEEGVWVASNATILAPCKIGKHSVIGACSLVNKDVPSYTIVAGIPAKIIKKIDH